MNTKLKITSFFIAKKIIFISLLISNHSFADELTPKIYGIKTDLDKAIHNSSFQLPRNFNKSWSNDGLEFHFNPESYNSDSKFLKLNDLDSSKLKNFEISKKDKVIYITGNFEF